MDPLGAYSVHMNPYPLWTLWELHAYTQPLNQPLLRFVAHGQRIKLHCQEVLGERGIFSLSRVAPWPKCRFCFLFGRLGLPVVPFLTDSFFGWKGSPAQIDYRKSWYPYSNLSAGGPRRGFPFTCWCSGMRECPYKPSCKGIPFHVPKTVKVIPYRTGQFLSGKPWLHVCPLCFNGAPVPRFGIANNPCMRTIYTQDLPFK